MGQIPEVYKEKKGSSTIYYDILDKFKFDTCKYLSQRALGFAFIYASMFSLPALDYVIREQSRLKSELTGIESKINNEHLSDLKKKSLVNSVAFGAISFLVFYGFSRGLNERKYDHVKFKYIETANGLRIDENGNTLT